MCICVVLCVDETCYFICVKYSDAIKLPKSYPPPLPPLVGRGYRLSHFWLAKEVNIEVKKEVAAIVLIKTIKYYENTKYTLKKGKKKSAEWSCV